MRPAFMFRGAVGADPHAVCPWVQAKSARDGLTSQLEGNLLKQQEELQQKAAPAAAQGDTAALEAAQADLEAVVAQLTGLQQQVKDAEHKRDKADKEVGAARKLASAHTTTSILMMSSEVACMGGLCMCMCR